MPPPPPPEEIAELMQFIAEKAKNVTTPMNVKELCKQFKAERGSLLSMGCLESRIRSHRLRIHAMSEFDMETKAKLIFALSASIDAGFLTELKKVAYVKVDDQQRIVHYEQKNGTLELSAKYLQLSTNQGEKRNNEIFQFLAKKSKTVDSPIPDRYFSREFNKTTGCSDPIESIEYRYQRVKRTIYESTEIDKNTKIKMMFISNAKLSDETLKELRKDAVVEVDERGRIIKYKGNDGRLKLEGRHGMSTSQRDFKKKRLNLVKFLIERTKDAKYPMSISSLAADFQTKFDSSESQKSTIYRIECFRQRICSLNQFDISTKVKIMFALSASVDAKFLEEIQKDAYVELDAMKRIKTYIAHDGSLELERDHLLSGKIQEGKTNVLNESTGERYTQFTSMSQNIVAIQKGRKRAKVPYSSSEVSEEKDNDEESMKREMMDCDTNNADNGIFDYFHDDPPYYEEDIDHIQMEKKPESLLEGKTEMPSTSMDKYRYEKRFFDYDPPIYKKDLEHFLEEKKPENYLEVKLEVPEESSTNNLEYHNEEISIEPKPEWFS